MRAKRSETKPQAREIGIRSLRSANKTRKMFEGAEVTPCAEIRNAVPVNAVQAASTATPIVVRNLKGERGKVKRKIESKSFCFSQITNIASERLGFIGFLQRAILPWEKESVS